MTTNILQDVLATLSVPGPARDVYADLVTNGNSPARVIATRLAMTRPSVYDQLKILIENGLVVERDMDGKTEFAIRDLNDLERLLADEESRIENIRKKFSREKDSLAKRAEIVEPRIRFVSGREAILHAMHDMLWDERIVLRAVWPYEEMIDALGVKNLAAFNEKRIRNKLHLRTIWTHAPKKGEASIWKDGDEDVERRFAPSGFAPKMAYTIYGDKVLFVSSAAESFGFVVHSADFAELMSQQFDLLWGQSKKGR